MTAPARTDWVVTRLDHRVLRSTRRTLGGTPAVPVARGLDTFGVHAPGWLAVGALGWATGRRRADWAAATSGVLAAHASGGIGVFGA